MRAVCPWHHNRLYSDLPPITKAHQPQTMAKGFPWRRHWQTPFLGQFEAFSEQLGLISAFVCEKTNCPLAPNALKGCLQWKSLIPRDKPALTKHLLEPTGSNFIQRAASWALTSFLVTCQKNSANPKMMVAHNLIHQSCTIYRPHDDNLSLLHKRKVKSIKNA